MVEMALAFPILLLILAGTLEVGKYFNDYLTFLDATREGARYAADGDLLNNVTEPSSNCDDNFFHQAACLAKQNISSITYDDLADDIVVSAMSVDGTGHIVPNSRFPRPISAGPPPSWMPDYRDGLVSSAEEGWSYCKHIIKTGCTPKTSRFTNAAIEAMLATNPTPLGNNPGTGIVIVEIYRLHRQFLGLIPPGLSFLPQEVIMHAYTMMPLPSVAPPPSYTP
ncbi:hypothetical protein TFLX_05505 [Thermoflexales bacterium]|nr:hypothetical protein TFLX_05505 [Thermoflexales bacterium]